MQKTLIKSLLAVAVAGTFATGVNAVDLPYQDYQYVKSDGSVAATAIHENFVVLNAGLTNAEGRLNGRLDGHDTRLTTAEGKVTTLEGTVTALDTGLTTAESDILTNTNNISQNATNIAANTGRLTAAEGRLDDHDTAIAGHGTRLTTAEGRIDLNSHAIADNYKEMKNNFAAVNSRIDKLDDKMKKGFASQAALNGLFQPYNVGKFNVSAAIGGYDSEQAMALGAGYRCNENFAIKAGIASDLSGFDHVTYNVGANFEF